MAYMDPEIVTGDIARVFDGEPVRSRDHSSTRFFLIMQMLLLTIADASVQTAHSCRMIAASKTCSRLA